MSNETNPRGFRQKRQKEVGYTFNEREGINCKDKKKYQNNRIKRKGKKYFLKLIAKTGEEREMNSPKHLLKLVFLSIKTLLEMTFPKGLKMEARSVSPYSTEQESKKSQESH